MIVMIVLYLLVIFYSISTVVTIANVISDGFGLPLTPAEVYDAGRLNWFGAVMLYLLIVLIFPVYYIIAFVRFIFTVGRN